MTWEELGTYVRPTLEVGLYHVFYPNRAARTLRVRQERLLCQQKQHGFFELRLVNQHGFEKTVCIFSCQLRKRQSAFSVSVLVRSSIGLR